MTDNSSRARSDEAVNACVYLCCALHTHTHTHTHTQLSVTQVKSALEKKCSKIKTQNPGENVLRKIKIIQQCLVLWLLSLQEKVNLEF